MTTLVTGASGFTGSHTVKHLLSQGHPVRAMVRTDSDLARLAIPGLDMVNADLGDRRSLKVACDGVRRIIHCAAYVDLGRTDSERMQRVNVEGTQALLDAAQASGVQRFVHCSTIGVFGDTQGQIADEGFQRQQMGVSGAYDHTKLEAQRRVDAAKAEGFETVSVLPSGIFGVGDPHFGQVVARFRQGRLPFWPALDRPTGIVHVEDVASALVLAADKGRPGAWYIASAGELTQRRMFEILGPLEGQTPPKELPKALVRMMGSGLDIVAGLTGIKVPLDRERVHYLYDRCVRVSADRARSELGWSPMEPEEIVRSLVS